MNHKVFLERLANLKTENRLLKFFVIVVGVSSIVSAFISWRAVRYQKVILVPPGLSEKVAVWGNDADDAYVREFTEYVSCLLFTYSPANARAQFSEVLKYVHPSLFQEARERLYSLAEAVELSKISSVFYPFRMTVRRKGSEVRVEVDGNLIRKAEGGGIVDSGPRKIPITFVLSNGRMLIKNLPFDVMEGKK